MKKTSTIYKVLCLSSVLSISYAFEIPTLLESNITDDIITFAHTAKENFKREGISQVFYVTNLKTYATGYQCATPLKTNAQALYRIEGNILHTKKYGEDNGHLLFKIGGSGRRILSSNCIVGGYSFWNMMERNRHNIRNMVTSGLEFVFPKYGSMLVANAAFHPTNIFQNNINRFYQFSFRGTLIKPQVLEISIVPFAGVLFTKSPGTNSSYYFTLASVKSKLPIKKWKIDQRLMGGISVIYDRKERDDEDNPVAWYDRKNIKISVYVQGNWLKQKAHNSLRDYLRMPIDQSFNIPYHPLNEAGYVPVFQGFDPNEEEQNASRFHGIELFSMLTPKPSISDLKN